MDDSSSISRGELRVIVQELFIKATASASSAQALHLSAEQVEADPDVQQARAEV